MYMCSKCKGLSYATFDKSFYDTVSSKVKDYSELSPKTTQPILDEPYTIDEVTEQIQTLKCRKAPGPDYITNEHSNII
jgi:hypothetical protein